MVFTTIRALQTIIYLNLPFTYLFFMKCTTILDIGSQLHLGAHLVKVQKISDYSIFCERYNHAAYVHYAPSTVHVAENLL